MTPGGGILGSGGNLSRGSPGSLHRWVGINQRISREGPPEPRDLVKNPVNAKGCGCLGGGRPRGGFQIRVSTPYKSPLVFTGFFTRSRGSGGPFREIC